MHKLIVHDRKGHTTTEFDYTDEVQVAAMRFKFDELTRNGYLAMAGKADTKEREQVRTFDPQVEEHVFIAPIAGG